MPEVFQKMFRALIERHSEGDPCQYPFSPMWTVHRIKKDLALFILCTALFLSCARPFFIRARSFFILYTVLFYPVHGPFLSRAQLSILAVVLPSARLFCQPLRLIYLFRVP